MKAQIEFISTYGWIILVSFIALGALFFFNDDIIGQASVALLRDKCSSNDLQVTCFDNDFKVAAHKEHLAQNEVTDLFIVTLLNNRPNAIIIQQVTEASGSCDNLQQSILVVQSGVSTLFDNPNLKIPSGSAKYALVFRCNEQIATGNFFEKIAFNYLDIESGLQHPVTFTLRKKDVIASSFIFG